VRLLIDPEKSAQENAAEYYKQYKKAVSGSEDLKQDIEITKKQLEKLASLYEEILNENTASIAKTYFALYNVLNEPANIAKADAAYETLERLKVFPALNTK
jgi:hypothetical protein